MRAPFALPRSRRCFVHFHRASPPRHLCAEKLHGSDSPLWSRELTDHTHVPVGFSSALGNVVSGDPLHVPFRALLLGYATHPALLSLSTGHTLLFDALSASADLQQQLTMLNPCRGHLVEVQARCIDATWSLVRYYRADTRRVLALSPQHRRHLDEIHLVHLVTTAGPNAGLLVSKELARGCELSLDVACTLLSVPCTPDVLRALLLSTLRSHAVAIDAQRFQRMAHALLSNDNFFTERHFKGMHSLLLDVLLPSLRGEAARRDSFDFVSVRWTTLMNKWSRVYAKFGRGSDLHDCLNRLLQAVPAAETKFPASFYVRLLGAVFDEAMADKSESGTGAGWARIKTVATDAIRLFGRNPEDLHAVWVLLLKGALTLSPLHEDHRRLLEAYHLCAQCGHAVAVNRQGFLQVIRLVAAAVSTSHLSDVTQVVQHFCTFMHEQTSVSFLWLLDGVGTVMTELWQRHRLEAQGEAAQLLRVLEALLRERRVSGVELHSNPAIARALEHFQIGCAPVYWWTCGCGEVLPCTSKRCTLCLRRSSVSWVCSQCRIVHRTPCKTQSCSCDCPNPRLAAALKAKVSICDECGLVTDAAGHCSRCQQQLQENESTVECTHCHSPYKASGVHCPQCFAPNPDKQLYLWHCVKCEDFNYSMWSSCRSCKTPRRTGALCISFVPWRCGCDALNHPCRLTCGRCGTGEHHHTYTCAGCSARVSLHSLRRTSLTVDGRTLSLHLCPRCQCAHPRDDLVLYSPSLSRHCMLCARPVNPSIISLSGSFLHCGVVQRVAEHYVFRCTTPQCSHTELQTGYHCRHCHFPRPEVEVLLREEGNSAASWSHVWRCLNEVEDDSLCGQWNYGWCAHCLACGRGRPESLSECRAKAQMWTCVTCGAWNRPIDVLFCPHCSTGLQPMRVCDTCGLPHLSYACRVDL
ncbi:hypothetical protein JKF63_04487 [Porcisia hertigi]|uniref:RanBP2-type domain-containing protein n=1 Tax=Porcisia hertigi TaxID=2761500 RepID=A0A836LEA9_9TRYP|nr:hypothetical protein JKF63_04487 [Porcisia hertigi]